MADILKILLIILGILLVYVSYWLLAEALFPALVDRASREYGRPVRVTLIGLACAIVPVVLGLVCLNLPNPLVKVVGWILVLMPSMLGLVGSAGLTQRIGAGLPSPVDEKQPWRRVLRGGILLACSFLLPVIGWIILPVWALVSGFGAFVLAVREQRGESPASNPTGLVPASEGAG